MLFKDKYWVDTRDHSYLDIKFLEQAQYKLIASYIKRSRPSFKDFATGLL